MKCQACNKYFFVIEGVDNKVVECPNCECVYVDLGTHRKTRKRFILVGYPLDRYLPGLVK